jgi:hypothetical protein
MAVKTKRKLTIFGQMAIKAKITIIFFDPNGHYTIEKMIIFRHMATKPIRTIKLFNQMAIKPIRTITIVNHMAIKPIRKNKKNKSTIWPLDQ